MKVHHTATPNEGQIFDMGVRAVLIPVGSSQLLFLLFVTG